MFETLLSDIILYNGTQFVRLLLNVKVCSAAGEKALQRGNLVENNFQNWMNNKTFFPTKKTLTASKWPN